MLTRLVLLLSVVAVNFVCESVSPAESTRVRKVTIMSSGSPGSSSSSNSSDFHDGTHSVRTRASSASSGTASQRSPLVEIMLRILDTIQVVPKRRPRRNVKRNSWHSKVAVRMVVTTPEQPELDKAPLFSGSGISSRTNNQPLMESSLEQTIHDADQHLSDENDSHQQSQSLQIDSISTEDEKEEEEIFPDYSSSDSYEANVREETDEKIYDLLLKILQILDDQAHRDAERVRRLETLRALDDHLSNEHPTEDDDDDGGDLDDDIESD